MKKLLSFLRSPLIPICGVFLCVFSLIGLADDLYAAIALLIFLSITLASLFLSDLKRTKTETFIFGAFSSALIILGRFDYNSPWFEIVGIFGLFFTAFLNVMRNVKAP